MIYAICEIESIGRVYLQDVQFGTIAAPDGSLTAVSEGKMVGMSDWTKVIELEHLNGVRTISLPGTFGHVDTYVSVVDIKPTIMGAYEDCRAWLKGNGLSWGK